MMVLIRFCSETRRTSVSHPVLAQDDHKNLSGVMLQDFHLLESLHC